MRLSYYCRSCKKKNYLQSISTNRFDLQKELGDEIARNCNYCGTFDTRHINTLYAEPSAYVLWLSLGAMLVLTTGLWYFGFIAAITFSAPIWLYYDAHKRASYFNKTKVRRK